MLNQPNAFVLLVSPLAPICCGAAGSRCAMSGAVAVLCGAGVQGAALSWLARRREGLGPGAERSGARRCGAAGGRPGVRNVVARALSGAGLRIPAGPLPRRDSWGHGGRGRSCKPCMYVCAVCLYACVHPAMYTLLKNHLPHIPPQLSSDYERLLIQVGFLCWGCLLLMGVLLERLRRGREPPLEASAERST